MLMYMVSFLPIELVLFIEAIATCTSCNLLKRFILCTISFWWHCFVFNFINTFTEDFPGVSQCSSMGRSSFVNGRRGLPKV